MKPVLELVTTGSELLNGSILNRHAQWLGAHLANLGWTLGRDTTVPDDAAAIRDAIASAFSRAEVVIVTGGLGPASDDVTRDVAAAWAGTKVVMHEPTRLHVAHVYAARNKPLNAMVERHALVVEGADVLDNRHGLAPGEHITAHGRHLFLLPGPPREFQGVMRDHVLPWLDRQGVAAKRRIAAFSCVGVGESDIATRLEQHGFGALHIDTAYCAEPARVLVRITERADGAADFDRAVALVRRELGPAIYTENDEAIEQTVHRLCRERGVTLAVAESCTGGLIGQRLTALPGSSAYLRGGVIAYHNDVKADVLQVPCALLATHGAVSEPVARAMAEGVRRLAQADYGIAVTGIAGPDGGTPEKPVGLVFIAVAGARGTEARPLRLGGGREVIRESSATLALDLLRRTIDNQP